MPKISLIFLILSLDVFVSCQWTGSGTNGNLRLCVVENRGTYRKAPKFCPILERENSGIECVIANDRLDCLRRMSKGTVDFGVFNPEDLVLSQLESLDLLVTNELTFKSKRKFASEVACLVSRSWLDEVGAVGTPSVILRNSTLCHPGQGSIGLTDALSDYLESRITERSCDPKITAAENKVISLSRYFRAACKPGPWVFDEKRDAELKKLHPSLCSACNTGSCSSLDQYAGRQGSLNCLTYGAGDFTWANVEDIKFRFGLNGKRGLDDPERFAYLCQDGSVQKLTNNTQPCVWLNIPWKVIVAKRKSAEAVSALERFLTNETVVVDGSWRQAMTALLESKTALSDPLQPQQTIPDYLGRAKGFQEAYSRSSCDPPRQVTVCTSSVAEQSKCDWLAQAASVYGVEPPLQCTQRTLREECFTGTGANHDYADVVIGSADWLVPAQRDYNVTPILFEANPTMKEMHVVTAYVKKNSKISKMADIRGKSAAFPIHDGVAWHSLTQYLDTSGLMKIGQPFEHVIATFFGESCVPGVEKVVGLEDVKERLTKKCAKEDGQIVSGEESALKLLVEGSVDVAFVSMGALAKYTGLNASQPWASSLSEGDLRPICPEQTENDDKYCFLSWSSPGQIYVSRNLAPLRKQEILNVFKMTDKLFGKNTPFHTAAFSMYGPFGSNSDVLFHDNINSLVPANTFKENTFKNYPRNFETAVLPKILNRKYDNFNYNIYNGAGKYERSFLLLVTASLVLFLIEP